MRHPPALPCLCSRVLLRHSAFTTQAHLSRCGRNMCTACESLPAWPASGTARPVAVAVCLRLRMQLSLAVVNITTRCAALTLRVAIMRRVRVWRQCHRTSPLDCMALVPAQRQWIAPAFRSWRSIATELNHGVAHVHHANMRCITGPSQLHGLCSQFHSCAVLNQPTRPPWFRFAWAGTETPARTCLPVW